MAAVTSPAVAADAPKTKPNAPAKQPGAASTKQLSSTSVKGVADVTFTLKTGIADGKLVFIGNSGNIKDQINPVLNVREGAVVQINLVNGDGAQHDISVPQFNVTSDKLNAKGASTAWKPTSWWGNWAKVFLSLLDVQQQDSRPAGARSGW